MKKINLIVIGLSFCINCAGQIFITTSDASVRINRDGQTKTSANESVLPSNTDITGVTIINDQVFIDGIKIEKHTTKYYSKKSKKSYVIIWGKNNNISVEEM